MIFEFKVGAIYQMSFKAKRNVLLNEYGTVNTYIKSEIDKSDLLIEDSKKGNLVAQCGCVAPAEGILLMSH